MRLKQAFAGLVAFLILVSCGEDVQKIPVPPRDTPVGKWERVLENVPKNPAFTEILELYSNGTYMRFRDAVTIDTGKYKIRKNTIKFTSRIEPEFYSRTVNFAIEEQKYLMTEYQPDLINGVTAGKQVERWEASLKRPNYQMLQKGNMYLPHAISPLLVHSMKAKARKWQKDAYPTGISLRAIGSGFYDMTFEYYSPEKKEQLKVTLTPYGIESAVARGRHNARMPIPDQFADLADIYSIFARSSEKMQTISYANLTMWKTFGAVWRLRAGRQLHSFAALDGKRILGLTSSRRRERRQKDINWHQAEEIWSTAMKQSLYTPPSENVWVVDCGNNCATYLKEDDCIKAGGSWYRIGRYRCF